MLLRHKGCPPSRPREVYHRAQFPCTVIIASVLCPVSMHTPVHTLYTTHLHESPVCISLFVTCFLHHLTFNALKDLYVLQAPELFTSPISRSIDWRVWQPSTSEGCERKSNENVSLRGTLLGPFIGTALTFQPTQGGLKTREHDSILVEPSNRNPDKFSLCLCILHDILRDPGPLLERILELD